MTTTKKPPVAAGGECQNPTSRKKSDMTHDTDTSTTTTSDAWKTAIGGHACPFIWCSGHDEWFYATPDDHPQRIHIAKDDPAIDIDRSDFTPGVLPDLHACIIVTETRTPTGAVYSTPCIRVEATAAQMGPASARALAHGLTALADSLTAIDAEVAAL